MTHLEGTKEGGKMSYIRVTLNIEENLIDQVRQLAIERSTDVHQISLSEIVREAIADLLNKYRNESP